MLDRRRVDAIPQPGGLWTIGEYMAEVSAASLAGHLGPAHAEASVGMLVDHVVLGLVKARPAAAGIELRLGLEQLRPATSAKINTRVLRLPVFAREGPLGPLLAE